MIAKVALAGTALIFLGTGGYFANEWRVCNGLEADFLRTIEGYTANVEAGALAGTIGVEFDEEERKRLQEMSLEVQQMQLTYIYERCGDQAGRDASKLASDELRESMKNILAIP
jgi:hypothetical protein